MTKKEYRELLKDDKWKKKRLRILDRDNYRCRNCSNIKYLEVHHIHYIQGTKPWEVPDNYLITLYRTCHSKEHKGKDINSFVLKTNRKTKPKSKKKNKQVVMSKRDRELQLRYNKLKRRTNYEKPKNDIISIHDVNARITKSNALR